MPTNTGISSANPNPESLSPEEQIIDTYSSYETNHYTGSQVSLFLGPVWVEDFVAIRWKQVNTKQPVYGWNEGYSDMDLDGNFLIQGTLTVNFRETDYLFRLIDQIRTNLSAVDRQEDIDRIIETQKGKFKTRIESRILETIRDESEASRLIERASQRIDLVVAELVNQNEDVFRYDLSVIAGNHRSKNFAIKIFEGFNISEESGASEPDDTPLYTIYSWYARKARARRRLPKGAAKDIQARIDVVRMLDEITTKLVNGYGLDNKKAVSDILADQTKQGRKLTLFDVASSVDYSSITNPDGTLNIAGKKRGFLDIPYISFENVSNRDSGSDISGEIDKSSQIGYGGAVRVGGNKYGGEATINKIVISFETPEYFLVNVPVYAFKTDVITGAIDTNSPSFPIDKSGTPIDTNTVVNGVSLPNNAAGIKYPVVLNNHSGEIQHIDHEIMQYIGFDIVGDIAPSPPQMRGSGIPVRQLFSLTAGTYNDRFRSGFTNSFLSLSEPTTVLENIVPSNKPGFAPLYPDTQGERVNRLKDVTVKLPVFSFTFFDPTQNIRATKQGETYKVEIVKPTPVYLLDRVLKKDSLEGFRKTGELKLAGSSSEELKKSFVGQDGKDFVFFPIASFFYGPDDLDDLIKVGQQDFTYNSYFPNELASLITKTYKTNPLASSDFTGIEKTMHIIPVILNYRKYAELIDKQTGLNISSMDSRWRNNTGRDLVLKMLSEMADDSAGELNSIINTPYRIHFDYLIKNASGLNPVGLSNDISFSMIHKLGLKRDSVVTDQDPYIFVQYFCLISTYPNFQNMKDILKKKIEDEKRRYSFVNFKGFSTEVKDNDTLSTVESVNDQISRFTNPGFHFTYPVGRKVNYETYIRTDFKTYDIQEGLLDTFLNFVAGEPVDNEIDVNFNVEIGQNGIGFSSSTSGPSQPNPAVTLPVNFKFDKLRGVLRYARELQKYANIKMDDGVGALQQHITGETGKTNLSQDLQALFGTSSGAIKEWVGYFKSLVGGPVKVFKDLFGKNPSTVATPLALSVQPEDQRNPAEEDSMFDQERTIEYDLKNAVGFSGEVYVNVHLRKAAEDLYSYFSKSAYDTNIITTDRGRGKDLHNSIGRDVVFGSGATAESLITRINKSTEARFGAGEDGKRSFVSYVVALLSKKMLDFNNADVDRIQVASKRFYTSRDSKSVLQKPAFTDPSDKDMAYVRFVSTSPSKTAILKYGVNKKEGSFALSGYKID